MRFEDGLGNLLLVDVRRVEVVVKVVLVEVVINPNSNPNIYNFYNQYNQYN
ncbi:MAG: hypothetical protein JST50_00415 [Bacteroidetes bacterium]|nr:hypothetical protein [Bacteroidota bacterium]